MIVRTKFNTDLNQIAKDIGITANFSYVGHARNGQNRYNGVLYPVSDKFRRLGFYETPKGNRSRVNAVCAHGHYAFMKKLFEIDPEATVESSWTRQIGQRVTADNLERMNDRVENRNIGSIMNPAYFGELCICSGLYPFVEKKQKKKTLEQTVKSISEDREKFGLEAFIRGWEEIIKNPPTQMRMWTTTMRRRYWRLRQSGLSHEEAVSETEHPVFSKTAKGFD